MFNHSNLYLRKVFHSVFDVQGEGAVMVADIGGQNATQGVGREMCMAKFLSLFHEDS